MDKRLLFWLVVVLNLTDCVMTTLIIGAGGYEANPVVDMFLVRFGAVGVVFPKLLPIMVLGVLVYTVSEKYPLLTKGLYLVSGVYATLVLYQVGLFLGA